MNGIVRVRLIVVLLSGSLGIGMALAAGWHSARSAGAVTTFVVNAVGDDRDKTIGDGVCATEDGICTLRAAVQEANLWPGNDRILFSAAIPTPATFALARVGDDDTALNGDLDIADSLTIVGRGMDNTVIDAGAIGDRAFEVLAGARATLSGLTVRRGSSGSSGGGILNGGVLTLTDSAVLSNTSNSFGGGISNTYDGVLTVVGSTLRANTSRNSGGGIDSVGSLFLMDTTVRANRSISATGGGIQKWNPGTMRIENATISQNWARSGGGVSVNGSETTILATGIHSNTAVNVGGGMYTDFSSITITLSIISGNQAEEGGGIGAYSAVAIVQDSTLRNNQASGDGGGIFGRAYPPLPGQLTVRSSTLSANLAQSSGGGLYVTDGYRAALVNSTLSGNNADTGGGGLNLVSGTVGITNTTIAGNLADANDDGGGYGGGIRSTGGTLRLRNAIVAYNVNLTGGIAADDDCSGYVASAHFSLIGNASGCLISAGSNNVLDQNARLLPLTGNGGPTQTRALRPNSPAVDAGGSVGCPARDQRGYLRPQDGDADAAAICDMGAYEYVRPGPFLPLILR